VQGGFSYCTAGIRVLTRSRGVCSQEYRHGKVIDRPVKEPEQATWPELRAAGEYWLMTRPSPASGRADATALPVTDRPQAATSNFSPDIVLGTESTGFVEDLVRPRGRGCGR